MLAPGGDGSQLGPRMSPVSVTPPLVDKSPEGSRQPGGNQALLRRHLMLQERAILLEIGRDPATLPPVPSLEDIELERPEALGIPLEKIADAVFALQDAEDGAKRRGRDQQEVRVPDPTPPPPPTETARSSRVALRSRIGRALSRSPAERVPAVELELQPREAIR